MVLFFLVMTSIPGLSSAQGMMNFNGSGTQTSSVDRDHTAREEAEGKSVWEKFQKNELKCESLTEEQFGALGEYFMGQMMGESHAAMNNMITAMMGEDGERQVHVIIGKRLSKCDPNAEFPKYFANNGMFRMMINGGMMGNYWNPYNTSTFTSPNFPSMMNFGYGPSGFGFFGPIFMILFWVLIIVGIVFLIKWLAGQNRSEVGNKKSSALDILKERYAK